MTPDILITGAGVVSAVGIGKAESLKALRSGKSGIKGLFKGEFPLAEVPLSNEQLAAAAGAPKDWPRTTLLSILALKEALEDAGEGSMPLISGTTVGGMDLTEKSFPQYSDWHSCGASTDLAANLLGRFSFATTLSTACSSAANALIFGANLIRCGKATKVMVGGSESLSLFHINGFNSLMILDRRPCRPFDKDRAGLNLGEGAAFLVLESAESARERGAKPYARLVGYGNACDAFHQTASSENGEGAFLAMEKALKLAGLKAGDISYVNAHGTGTPNNDASESAALRRIFGECMPPVSSTKPFTGHTTSASGSIEAVFCILALQHGFIPPQLNWETPDPSCITPYCGSGETRLDNVLCNAFGFGGNDSSIILQRV